MKQKPHLLFTWLDELVRDEAVLDAVEGVIDPTSCAGRAASSPRRRTTRATSLASGSHLLGARAGRHRDRLDRAFAEHAGERLHARRPGSHKRDVLPHTETFAAHNLLSRGQEIQVEVDERQARDLVAQPGEMSLHHVKLIHGSGPNQANDRRIGFAIRYVPTYVRQTAGAEDSAMLVRGVDVHHFLEETPPAADLDEAALAEHAAVTAAARILMRGRAGRASGSATNDKQPSGRGRNV